MEPATIRLLADAWSGGGAQNVLGACASQATRQDGIHFARPARGAAARRARTPRKPPDVSMARLQARARAQRTGGDRCRLPAPRRLSETGACKARRTALHVRAPAARGNVPPRLGRLVPAPFWSFFFFFAVVVHRAACFTVSSLPLRMRRGLRCNLRGKLERCMTSICSVQNS